MAKKEYTVDQIKDGKAYGMKVKDQMEAIKKSIKKEPDPIAFTDSFEDKLREKLFEQEIAEIQKEEEEKINNPDFERSGYIPKVDKKPGLWDYVREDEITFFDPSLSYELTGYRPINDKEGLDFDPIPFREAGMIFERTGAYCEFPKDCKPYIDFWNEQKRRCVEGYTVGKYRITGDHYFFLNFYRLPVTKEKDGMTFVEEGFPVFTTEHYKWFHYVEMCEYLKKDVAALKCRGVGWSEIAACLSVRPFITTRDYTSLYTAFTQAFLDGVLEKCWLQLNWLNHNTNYGMYRARGKIDNAYHKRASKVDKDGVEYGRRSEIVGLVADNPRKVRGLRTQRLFFEESGSQPHLSTAWVQGEALITRAGRRAGTRFAWGCVCDGTKVYKKDGTPCNIEDLKQEDGIIGFKNGKSNVEPITYMQGEAYKPCVRITTDHGILECSEDHPILTRIKKYYKKPDGKWQRYYIYDFIEAKDVKKYVRGSSIAMAEEIDHWGRETLFDPYLVGLLIGDGSYCNKNTPVLHNCDDDVNCYVESKYDTTTELSYLTKDGRMFKVTRIRSITKHLRNIGIYGQSKNRKRLPNNWMTLSKQDAAEMLAGMFDTDGSIGDRGIRLAQSSTEILEQVQILLRKFGIFSTIYECKPRIAPHRKDKNTWYSLEIKAGHSWLKFREYIPIKIKYKIEHLNKICSWVNFNRTDGIIDASVRKVEPIGIRRIYNLTAGDSHTYLANDFITHNTGGDSDSKALDGLSQMFYNPESYNILPYKHNFTSDGEYVKTAFFLPAYAMLIDPKYMDHRGYTDMVKAKEYFDGERKKKSGQVLLDYCAEYCYTGEDALLKQGSNMFDTLAIADRLGQIRIQKMGLKPQHVKIYWDHANEATNPRQKVKLVEDPNSKIIIYEQPKRDPDGNVYKNLYVAGIDAIDQAQNDSSGQKDVSDFCIVIKRRTFGSELPNYVAIYKDRPRDIVEAYENAMKLLVYYNCKAMLEHTKIGIIMYFRSKKKESLFMTRPKSTMSDIRRGNSNMLGVPATEIILKHGLELINQFLMECVYNVNIDSMLEQLLKYSWENKRKFDIVSAMIVAEIGDEDLMGFAPRIQNEVQKQWKDFGWYTDSYGRKRYGTLPDNYGIRS